MTAHSPTFVAGPLDRDAVIYVAGHGGLVGSAIWRTLAAAGFTRLVGARSKDVDLTDRRATREFFERHRPEYVIDAAARVGGIYANSTRPVEFLSENLQIQVNLMDAALAVEVRRLLFLGSSCIYPKFADQPIREDSLLTGVLEPTNFAYAVAKITGITQAQAVRQQYGLPWISAMPTNLYGPGDNFSRTGSHVLPAMIRRFDEAVRSRATSVTNWGTGTVRREFLRVDDLAAACLHLLETYDGDLHVTSASVQTSPSASSRRSSHGLWVTEERCCGTPQCLMAPPGNCSMSPLSRAWLETHDYTSRRYRQHYRLVPRAHR